MTPSRAYGAALTSRFPSPFPCRVCGCPLGKNCSLNVCLSEYNYFTDFQGFGLGRKLRSSRAAGSALGGLASVVAGGALVHHTLYLWRCQAAVCGTAPFARA